MIPTHPQRLQTMLRSMIEVIIPAIKEDNELARDQAQILVANLRLLIDQCDHGYEYEMLELKSLATPLRCLLDKAQGGSETAAAERRGMALLQSVESVAAVRLPPYAQIAALVRDAWAAMDALLAASHVDGTADWRTAAVDIVLAQATAQNFRQRVWLRATGLDRDSSRLPSPEELIAREEKGS